MKTALTALALALAVPAPAAGAIRTLFVGINQYLYVNDAGGELKNLNGSVNDVADIKDALAKAYRLTLDTPVPGVCRSHNTISVTLTDHCATRLEILTALRDQIAASAPGDTVLFYFAGHGAQFADVAKTQPGGQNDTILAADARKPGADASQMGDIIDVEFYRIITDAKTSRGVNIVTIFDSCNSGTATRDFGSRDVARGALPLVKGGPTPAPDAMARGAPAPPPLPPPAGRPAQPGYSVHFAAARDGEEARETDIVVAGQPVRRGRYSLAMAETLRTLPGARFADIAADVQRRFDAAQVSIQHPRAEGELRAALGAPASDARVFEAVADKTAAGGSVVTIAGGRLSGVTIGSRFAVYATMTAALGGGAAAATGSVSTADASTATLNLDAGATPWPVGQRLIVREAAHAFGDLQLQMTVTAAGEAQRQPVLRALADLRYVRVAPGGDLELRVAADGRAALFAADGVAIGTGLGPVAAADFGDRLGDALQKLARVQALLALRTPATPPDGELCIDPKSGVRSPADLDAYFWKQCRPPVPPPPPTRFFGGDDPTLAMPLGQPSVLVVRNRSDDPRYLYVLSIDPAAKVEVVWPRTPESCSSDRVPVAGNDAVKVAIAPDVPGRYRFVTLAADAPIDIWAFSQEGLKDFCGGGSELNSQILATAKGEPNPLLPRVGRWTATVTDAKVVAPGSLP